MPNAPLEPTTLVHVTGAAKDLMVEMAQLLDGKPLTVAIPAVLGCVTEWVSTLEPEQQKTLLEMRLFDFIAYVFEASDMPIARFEPPGVKH